jgi:hypothetical protein
MKKIIVNAHLSNCCKTSVSPIYGTDKKPFHYKCNSCGKECTKLEVPYWELTEKGKYKELNTKP